MIKLVGNRLIAATVKKELQVIDTFRGRERLRERVMKRDSSLKATSKMKINAVMDSQDDGSKVSKQL